MLDNFKKINTPLVLLTASTTYGRFSIHNFANSFLGGFKKYVSLIGTKINKLCNIEISKLIKKSGFRISYFDGAFLFPIKILNLLPKIIYSRLIHNKGYIFGYFLEIQYLLLLKIKIKI